jgi:2-phosphosulfolactate phosphatase
VAAAADVAVVVDVLSFTTTLSVAADRGVEVLPYRWRDESAVAFAAERDATLAVGRFEARQLAVSTVTLSPRSILDAVDVRRLVLPSPNGSALSFDLAADGVRVVGACLRNRGAVARWLHRRLSGSPDAAVALVPAGERWPDGSLRPGLEDLWGAGAVAAALEDLGTSGLSAEARAAAAAYRTVEADLPGALADCSSGRELVEAGYADDVAVAAERDTSDVVPVLESDRFLPELSERGGAIAQ